LNSKSASLAYSNGIKKRFFNAYLRGIIMNNEDLLERIVLDPKIKVGKPVIRGTRLTVDFILNLLAHGSTINEILDEYEGLTLADIQACFLFATKSIENTEFMPLVAEG
jgi:uncharacterized protein (DUF433 family)